MDAYATPLEHVEYPVAVEVKPALENRDRVTAFFRFFLALPHLILVGGPVAVILSMGWESHHRWGFDFGYGSGGILGMLLLCALVYAWFVILFTGEYPPTVQRWAIAYLRWRVRAITYMTLLRDEYPPFGEGAYAAELQLKPTPAPRDRVTIAFRILLAIPHMFVLWFLSLAWAFATAFAWVHILVTGRYPRTLYGFAIGVLAWSTRVEAYTLLLVDDYPPFTLRA